MIETTICTFDISVSFSEWVEKFDNDEASERVINGVKVLFRGVSRENPSKAVVIVQALEGALEKHIIINSQIFQDNGAVMKTVLPTVWPSY